MSGEFKQFIRAEVLRAFAFRFELLVFRSRVRRGLLSFGPVREPVIVSSMYEPEAWQTHQRWPEDAMRHLLRGSR